MKQLPALLAIAKSRLAAEEERLDAWKVDAQSDVEWALLRAEYAVGYIEHSKAWRDVVTALTRNGSPPTVEALLAYAEKRVRQAMAREVRNVDILESTRVLSRVTAWQEVILAIVEP